MEENVLDSKPQEMEVEKLRRELKSMRESMSSLLHLCIQFLQDKKRELEND